MFRPAQLPVDLADVLGAVRKFAVIDPSLVTPEERAAWLSGLQQLTDAASAYALQVLGAFDGNGDGEVLHGARSTVSWLTGALGIAPGDASSRVHLARASRSRLAPVVRLLADGQLTYDHVRGIGTAVRDLPDEHVAPAVDVLADLATRVDVKQLQQAGRHLQDVVNPDGALAANNHDFSRRRLHLSPLLDGMVAVDGLLDPESAATLDAALAPFLVPAGSSDDRTTPQRRADGLVELANVAMSQTDLGISGGTRPQLSVLCTLPALAAIREGRVRAAEEITTPGWGRLERPVGGSVIGSVATQRIACDATISRVLIDSEGVPVGLGRAKRLFTGQQRRLLALRDGGCRFPGCGMPPAFADGHHVTPWAVGGETNLNNGVLMCRFHHNAVHEGPWSIRTVDSLRGANGELVFQDLGGQQFRSRPQSLTTDQLTKIAWWSRPRAMQRT